MSMTELTKAHNEKKEGRYAQPVSIDDLIAVANQLRQERRLQEAESLCREFLEKYPDQHRAFFVLGDMLALRGMLAEAEQVCQRGMNHVGKTAEGFNCYGKILKALGKEKGAEQSFLRALATGTDDVRSHLNLGNLFKDLGKFAEAEVHYREVIAINPDLPDSYNNLSILQMMQGKAAEAIQNNRKVLAINPDLQLSHSNLLFSMNFTPECSNADIYEESRRWDMRHGKVDNGNAIHHDNDPDPERSLRVGYISPDFRKHSVSYFFEPLLGAHHLADFQITCYSDLARPDETTRRLKLLSHRWRECGGLSDADLVELVRKDDIDILVDLTGHTANNRLKVFAAKPAPVQVNWLGSPNTTGLTAIDFRLTDDIADPYPEADPYYSEKQYRLPDGFVCYAPPKDAPDVSRLPALQNGFVTFGSFNTLAKITPHVLDLWITLLKRVERSHLLLKNMSLGDEETRRRYLDYLSSAGLDPSRIELCSSTAATHDHLNFYSKMDICLDTFPFNGFTTTCESLWMGVPVVTLYGDRHAGRVSASFLTCVGLKRLIARTPEEYIDIADELAGYIESLATLRSTLRARMQNSSLYDTAAFADKVERAYREMWREWCGKP